MITFDYFVPNLNTISSIGSGLKTTIVTFSPHGYASGLVVRIYIPQTRISEIDHVTVIPLGMTQLNGFIGPIVVTGPSSFILNVDSTNFDPYNISGVENLNSAIGQVSPIAEDAFSLAQAIKNNNNIAPEIFGPIPINP